MYSSRSKKCGELVRLKSGVENTKRFATINQPSGQLIVNIFLQGSSSVYVHSHWETHLEVLVTRWPHCEDTQERIGIALDQEMGTKGEGHIGASMAQETYGNMRTKSGQIGMACYDSRCEILKTHEKIIPCGPCYKGVPNAKAPHKIPGVKCRKRTWVLVNIKHETTQ